MPRLTTEVLIGTGTLYIATDGIAFPADPSAVPAVDWVDVGYSEEGWVFTVNRNFEDVMAAEEVDPLKILQTARELHLKGAAIQASIDNLKTALAGGTISSAVGPPATRTYVPPAASAAPLTKALLLRTDGPEVGGIIKIRDLKAPKGLSVGAIEMAHQKAPSKTMLAMDFRLIKPSAGNVFEITELT